MMPRYASHGVQHCGSSYSQISLWRAWASVLCQILPRSSSTSLELPTEDVVLRDDGRELLRILGAIVPHRVWGS